MGPVSVSCTIDVPRERVFDFLADLANRPAFMGPFMTEFRLQRLDSAGVGAAARFRVRERGLWMETVIAEVDAPHTIIERGSGSRTGRLPVHTAWELAEAGISGCEVRVVHWTEPKHPVDHLAERVPGMERFYRRSLSASLRRLRAILEDDLSPERASVGGGDRVPGAG